MTREEELMKALVDEKRHTQLIDALKELTSTMKKILEVLKPTEKTDGKD